MISIIVPVYNVEKYLGECVGSLKRLSFDWEAVLVDDGSTDGSGALCDELAAQDKRVRVVHQKNGGLSAARNTGIRSAHGEYIMFLDSDDFLDADETNKMVGEMDENVDVLMGLYNEYYTDSGRTVAETDSAIAGVSGTMPVDDFLKCVPEDGSSLYMVACRFVLKRNIVLDNDLFFCEGILHEDEDWTARLLAAAGTVQVAHHYYYQYRQAREGAITSTVKPKGVWSRLTIIERLEELSKSEGLTEVKRSYIRGRMSQLYLSALLDARVLDREEWGRAKQLFHRFDSARRGMCGRVGSLARLISGMLGLDLTRTLITLAYKFK